MFFRSYSLPSASGTLGDSAIASEVTDHRFQIAVRQLGFPEERHDRDAAAHCESNAQRREIRAFLQESRARARVLGSQGSRPGMARPDDVAGRAPVLINLVTLLRRGVVLCKK